MQPPSTRKQHRFLVPSIGVAILFVLILHQSGAFATGLVKPGTTPPPATQANGTELTIALVDAPVVYTTIGTVHSRSEIKLSSRIAARITDVTARAGDAVKNGDALVKLDDAELQATVARAQEHISSASSAVDSAKQGVERAKAALDLAEADLNRARQLFEKNVISQKQMDEASSAYRQSLSGFTQAQHMERTAAAELAAAGQARKEAEAARSYATITAPFDGVVSDRMVDPGDLASPGVLLMTVFDPTKLMLYVPIRESLVRNVKVGDTLSFTVGAHGGKAFAGEVREVVPAVDPGSRTFLVKICVGASQELMPGMCGTLELPIGSEKSIVIPARALSRVGQLEYVTLVRDGRQEQILVRSRSHGADAAKIVSGLAVGDTLLVPAR